MKFQHLIYAAVISILISGCKKEESVNTESTISKITTVVNLLDSAAVKYKETILASKDSLDALIEMANWCLKQPEVKIVYLIDHSMATVHFKNGLITPISVIPVDASGIHLLRGGGKGNQIEHFSNKTTDGDEHMIGDGNDKVMIFIPYYLEFYANKYPYLYKFSSGKQKLIPTLLTDRDADLAAIHTFADYGFIIIDSHGGKDGFDIRTKITEFDDPWKPGRTPFTEAQLKSILARSNNMPLDKIENGELKIAFKIYVKKGASANSISCDYSTRVTDRYIQNLPQLNKAVVFGNHCVSGFSYYGADSLNLSDAWKSIGAISYYGYAYSDGRSNLVGNDFCKKMEDSLITNLLFELDSTGIAHLAGNYLDQFEVGQTRITGGVEIPPPPPTEPVIPGTVMAVTAFDRVKYTEDYPPIPNEFYFQHFHDKSYKYKPCVDTITDKRDGQKYPTVCIGEQVWMAKNLNYAGAGAGVCYDGNASNCKKYGRLYSIEELTSGNYSNATPSGVQGICPAGWHVPSSAEWDTLIAFCGGIVAGGPKLRAKTDWPQPNNHTDDFGFSILPAGYGMQPAGQSANYQEIGTESRFWTTSTFNGVHIAIGASLTGGGMSASYGYKYSCRCVKD